MIQIIAFDADDTLWHNENLYARIQEKFRELLSGYHPAAEVNRRLYEMEMHNMAYFGYGIKAFTLSMIETAIELSDGQIQAREIQAIIGFAREMLDTEIHLMEQVEDVVAGLAHSYPLMLVTKGDMFEQQAKIAKSGIADYFDYIDVVNRKNEESYRMLLRRYGIDARHVLMVGNSLKSDVLPFVAIGGQAVHIPYHITWAHETVAALQGAQQPYFELAHIGLLPALVERLNQSS